MDDARASARHRARRGGRGRCVRGDDERLRLAHALAVRLLRGAAVRGCLRAGAAGARPRDGAHRGDPRGRARDGARRDGRDCGSAWDRRADRRAAPLDRAGARAGAERAPRAARAAARGRARRGVRRERVVREGTQPQARGPDRRADQRAPAGAHDHGRRAVAGVRRHGGGRAAPPRRRALRGDLDGGRADRRRAGHARGRERRDDGLAAGASRRT